MAESPSRVLAGLPPAVRRAATERLRTLTRAVGAPELEPALQAAVDDGRHDVLWLSLAVLRGSLPTEQDVLSAWRQADLDGVPALLARELARLPELADDLPDVEVVEGRVLVDVDRTGRFSVATGIQRVVREVALRWHRDRDVDLVSWSRQHTALQRATSLQVQRAVRPDDPPHGDGSEERSGTVLVPWRCTLVLPELAVELPRNDRLRALARFRAGRFSVLGHDCIAVTSAETTAHGVAGDVSWYLSAVKHADRVVATSRASAQEFSGFRAMLAAQGLRGPDVVEVQLPSEPRDVTPEELAAGGLRVGAAHLPLVLCVGSHEPRKNHLAVLQAAELLWRRGLRFLLVLVGGAGWRSELFDQQVEVLRAAGRPVDVVRSIGEADLWAAYRLARLTVFPSLHEGFGLPVAESLSVGTPVVTSDVGSMQEIAAGGGALLVDPRDDAALADAVGRLLTDDDLHARLRREALARTGRTWDQYADELWAAAVEDLSPR